MQLEDLRPLTCLGQRNSRFRDCYGPYQPVCSFVGRDVCVYATIAERRILWTVPELGVYGCGTPLFEECRVNPNSGAILAGPFGLANCPVGMASRVRRGNGIFAVHVRTGACLRTEVLPLCNRPCCMSRGSCYYSRLCMSRDGCYLAATLTATWTREDLPKKAVHVWHRLGVHSQWEHKCCICPIDAPIMCMVFVERPYGMALFVSVARQVCEFAVDDGVLRSAWSFMYSVICMDAWTSSELVVHLESCMFLHRLYWDSGEKTILDHLPGGKFAVMPTVGLAINTSFNIFGLFVRQDVYYMTMRLSTARMAWITACVFASWVRK